ncbi:von Willebrand factor A domain-containing protein 5A-like [Erpetoichthys calabaricus]|uniref:von Willebrand factor A domain-containing protein 5A-like n=1 Tax=Erpetoichthys calabaricus TaxID=27687 RepID=UPI0022345E62|nr:von Willebrand factor A domain-containing protein 5A-like [Erpetoichthys calabaricus]
MSMHPLVVATGSSKVELPCSQPVAPLETKGAAFCHPSMVRVSRPGKDSGYPPHFLRIDQRERKVRYGLLTQKDESVPLKSITVEVSISGFIADVSTTLCYENNKCNPVEAVFVFPMEDGSTIYDFHAEIGKKSIDVMIKDKQKAREDYDDAISSGQQAFLLEKTEIPDVFRLSVGSLSAGQKATLSLSYVTELPVEADDALRFCLPTVLCPRYTPQGTTSVTKGVPRVPFGSIPYTLSLTCHLVSPNGISNVKSNSALMPLEYLSDDKTEAKVSLSPGFQFDRDVVLLIYYNHPHQPTAIVENGLSSAASGSLMRDPVIMISLYPEFPELTEQSLSIKGEFIFLVDLSDSMLEKMNGDPDSDMRIESARDTLLLLLKSLPLDCHFNIYGFGSDFQHLFSNSVKYSQMTMKSAMKEVKSLHANFGGTNILAPLRDIFGKACIPGYPRQLFVFTDGEVENTQEVINEVKKNASSHRCFTFGIGDGASTALIKGMAKAGSGYFQFISRKDRIQPKVMKSLQFALPPAVTNIKLNWHLPNLVKVAPISETPHVLFNGQRTVLYGQLKTKANKNAVGRASLHYTLCGKEYKSEIRFGLKIDKHCRLTAHRLAAKVLINEKEDERFLSSMKDKSETIKKEIIKISTEAGIITSLTAFIAVHKEKHKAIQQPMVITHIPLASFPSCSQERISWESYYTSCIRLHPRLRGGGGGYGTPPTTLRGGGGGYGTPPTTLRGGGGGYGTPPTKLRGGGGGKPKDKVDEGDSADMPEVRSDNLLKLVSFQNVDGSWNLEDRLMTLLSKTEQEVLQKMPAEIKDKSVWATFLSLLWLHGFNSNRKDEWKFVALKAVAWIKAQTGLNLELCLQAGNDLLGCQMDLQTLGLQPS